MWTSKEAETAFKEWESFYKGRAPKGGWMILSLCILLVGLCIEILRQQEKQNEKKVG